MEFERAFYDAGGVLAAGVDPTGYGAAPPGFYWRPMLWAQVAPRGVGRYREGSVLVKDSGFELMQFGNSDR